MISSHPKSRTETMVVATNAPRAIIPRTTRAIPRPRNHPQFLFSSAKPTECRPVKFMPLVIARPFHSGSTAPLIQDYRDDTGATKPLGSGHRRSPNAERGCVEAQEASARVVSSLAGNPKRPCAEAMSTMIVDTGALPPLPEEGCHCHTCPRHPRCKVALTHFARAAHLPDAPPQEGAPSRGQHASLRLGHCPLSCPASVNCGGPPKPVLIDCPGCGPQAWMSTDKTLTGP